MIRDKEFVITCEFVPGRGGEGKSIEEIIDFGRKVVATGLPIHAVSLTDNPGGNPAISPDVLGKELQAIGVEALVHFACSDANRNMIESRAYALARDGLKNVLVITGDYAVSGYEGMAKPIFDLCSVQVIRYLKEMNKGLEIPGRKKGTFDNLPATDFFVGGAVSPFKKTEAELMTQFFKLEKKIQAGVDFIIPQLGYDIRKFAEILKYMKYRNISMPVLGNIYVLTKGAARFMNGGNVPGCVVTDELLAKFEEEAEAPDKGKAARLERAAQLMSLFKGLNFSGVHLGGFGLKFDDFEYIIKRAEEIGDNWREFIPNFRYNQENEYYLFPDDPELTFAEDKLRPVAASPRPRKTLHFQMGRLFHRVLFTEGTLGYRLAQVIYRFLEKRKLTGRFCHFCERQIKRLLFDCQECGDCALFDLFYVCPMSKCAKFQRNGPCGGSKDGKCEADEEKRCAWTIIYERCAAIGKLDELRKNYVPPINCSLSKTSSWANFFMGRDHGGKKIAAEKKKE